MTSRTLAAFVALSLTTTPSFAQEAPCANPDAAIARPKIRAEVQVELAHAIADGSHGRMHREWVEWADYGKSAVSTKSREQVASSSMRRSMDRWIASMSSSAGT